MYMQRLLEIFASAVIISVVLLGLYWLNNRIRFRGKNRNDKQAELDDQLKVYLDSIPQQQKSRFKNLTQVKSISYATMIVALTFSIIGGISAEYSPEEVGHTSADPAIQIAFWGWLLWGFSLVSMFISEGAAAKTTKGIVAKKNSWDHQKEIYQGKKSDQFWGQSNPDWNRISGYCFVRININSISINPTSLISRSCRRESERKLEIPFRF